MKIIELTEIQFRNYSKLHSARNYFQTVEYAHTRSEVTYYLGYINESDNNGYDVIWGIESMYKFKK